MTPKQRADRLTIWLTRSEQAKDSARVDALAARMARRRTAERLGMAARFVVEADQLSELARTVIRAGNTSHLERAFLLASLNRLSEQARHLETYI